MASILNLNQARVILEEKNSIERMIYQIYLGGSLWCMFLTDDTCGWVHPTEDKATPGMMVLGAINEWIVMLQSRDLESLDNKDDSGGYTWITLGRKNRKRL